MLNFKKIQDPLSKENLFVHEKILNSDPIFLKAAEGKNELTIAEIIQENNDNLTLGASFYYINQNNQPIGLINYLPVHPKDGCCWLGLFIIHKDFQQKGVGNESYQLFEKNLLQPTSSRVRLCVQKDNHRGAQFWQKQGYKEIAHSAEKAV